MMLRKKLPHMVCLMVWLPLAVCASCLPACSAEQGVTVVYQNGLNGYAGGFADAESEKGIKVVDNVKATDPRWPNPNYRHLVKFDNLELFIPTRKAQVLSAKITMHYFDEFWSESTFDVAFERCLDGNKDHAAKAADGLAVLKGDKYPDGIKTPRPSFVTWDLDPATVQKWIEDPKSNRGWVLRMKKRVTINDQGSFLWFHGFRWGVVAERPKLTVRYVPLENVPPFTPTLAARFDGVSVGARHVVRWTMPDPPDANGDKVHFEIEYGKDGAGWRPVAGDIADAAREYAWDTSKLPAEEGLKLRLRAIDDKNATSSWAVSDGTFRIVRGTVPFQIGIEPPLVKLRRDEPYRGRLGGEASVELARNEYEGVQVVLSGLTHALKNVRVSVGDLKLAAAAFAGSQDRLKAGSQSPVLAAKNVSVNFVGYVQTLSTDAYTSQWAGLWPDPLLSVESVDVPVGKVQPVWVTLYAPAGTPAGRYTGKLTITADGIEPQQVTLKARIFDFDLPTRGAFQAMTLDGGPHGNFYGLGEGRELDKIRRTYFEFLCQHRLPPGGYALKCWSGVKPSYPAKQRADGTWDFSEVEKRGQFLFDHGMNTFVMGMFDKPGRNGMPNANSAAYRSDFQTFMTAYAGFLRSKGWLKDAVVYNIDEAPAAMWEMCKENYRQTKAVNPDISVFQCLNDPPGVAALERFFDVIDVNVGQFNAGAAPKHLARGGRTWWCTCCWPSSHPNLFVDYPAMDARIIGWLSWKVGVQGWEYWDVDFWDNCLKPMKGKKFVDVVESKWTANSFGKYNGDGYLFYPGPDNRLLSSIRFEALRDGFEDYEYLAVLRAPRGQEERSRRRGCPQAPGGPRRPLPERPGLHQ